MESKYLKSVCWITISVAIFLQPFCVKGQGLFEEYREFIMDADSSIDIKNYDKTYIIHFNFCTSPKYCGDNLVKHIERDKNKKILIVCDNPKNSYLLKLKNNHYETLNIDFKKMEQGGLFSVYNMEIHKSKKIKKLI